MTKLELLAKVPFREVITSINLVDMTEDGRANLIVSTQNGDIRIYEYIEGKTKLEEIGLLSDLPPLSAIGIGDVIGNGVPDFVVGGVDNNLRVISFIDKKLDVIATTPLGSLPTAVGVLNVLSDDRAEVMVASSDGTLRCYGWFDIALDKLAHKVLERPIFSMQPLMSKGLPFSRFVFGDDSGHLFVYQYADDRLHERAKISVGGEVTLVASGDMTQDGNSEVMTVSDERKLTLLGIVKGAMERFDSVKAPKHVTSLKIGKFWENGNGQIIASHANSTITVLSLVGNRIMEDTSLKTKGKSVESHISLGDIVGDSKYEIVQTVGTDLFLIRVVEKDVS
ncbi:MAG: hypothetical protein ACFFF9_00660 [Candidatus Thorarchaeota archaeon]